MEKMKCNDESKIAELNDTIKDLENKAKEEKKNHSNKIGELENKIKDIEKEKGDSNCIINELNETINYLKNKINE